MKEKVQNNGRLRSDPTNQFEKKVVKKSAEHIHDIIINRFSS